MNRTLSVGMFAGIFAIAMGAIFLTGDSAETFMVASVPQTQTTQGLGMIGHVEYTVRDEANQIKSYVQTDNIVTEMGKNCVAKTLFDQSDSVGDCVGVTEYQYIAIGNHTAAGVPDGTETTMDNEASSTLGCANDAATGHGEMARKLVDPVITEVGADTQIVLDTSGDPFEFRAVNATSTTTVMQSGVFNGDVNSRDATNGHCLDAQGGTVADLFAIQDLNLDAGITVTSGDSLSVKWTITVGST